MTRHETLAFSREYRADPALLWRAWTEPDARAAWASPAPEVSVEFLSAECRPGGTEVSICRAPGMQDIRAEVGWIAVEPPGRTVATETLSQNGEMLSVALVTAEVSSGGDDGTHLRLTVQLCSLGEDMAPGYREGFGAALDNIGQWMAAASVERIGARV